MGTYDNRFLVTQDTHNKKVLPQYAALHAQNPDFFGWIRIEGTKVNYPVMFSPQEPERYLHKDFYGNYAKYGVPFVDGVTDVERSLNLLIHGHTPQRYPVWRPDKFLKVVWEEHRYIHLDTLYEERGMRLWRCAKIPARGGTGFSYYEYANIWDQIILSQYLVKFAIMPYIYVYMIMELTKF